MNFKKKIVSVLSAAALLMAPVAVSAQNMNMYVNNQFVVRDVVSVDGVDMLPIMDIAGEMGFSASMDGGGMSVILSSWNGLYYLFTVGDPTVYSNSATYRLSVTPRFINGKFMAPSTFFTNTFNMSYFWDSVTNTIFMNSNDVYAWLVTTPEYKAAANPSIYNGTWHYTPDGDSRPLIELSVSGANSSTVDLYGERMHGKGAVYNIGTASFINSNTAVANGSFDFAAMGSSVPVRYTFTFGGSNIRMDMGYTDGTSETYYFYR